MDALDWQALGLSHNPFTHNNEKSFFNLPSWTSRLEMLEHVAQYNNVLIMVKGECGCGKTTFMEYFHAYIAEKLSSYPVDGDSELSVNELLQIMKQAFSLPEVSPGSSTEETIETYVRYCQRQHRPALLMIDNAEQLPQETLNCLLKIIHSQDDGVVKLHIMLFAKPDIETWLSTLDWQVLESSTHEVCMPRLDVETTAAYLLHRFQAAGFNGDNLPLSLDEIDRINHEADGMIGQIGDITTQLLATRLQGKPKRRMNRPVLAGLMVIALAFITLTFLSPEQQIDPTPVSEQALSLPTPPPAPKLQPVSSIPALSPQLQEKRKLSSIAPVSQAALTEKIDFDTQPSANDQARAIAEVRRQYAKKVKKQPALVDRVIKVSHIQAKIKPRGYGIQLFGTHSPKRAKLFLKENGLSKRAAFYRTALKGKNWYVIVYGQYSDASKAHKALDNLPTELQKLHPWVRQYATIL